VVVVEEHMTLDTPQVELVAVEMVVVLKTLLLIFVNLLLVQQIQVVVVVVLVEAKTMGPRVDLVLSFFVHYNLL
jgi:hypothetical protein